MARRSHTCTAGVGRSLVVTTRRDPSGLKATPATPHRSGLASRASVRPVSISTRRMTLSASDDDHQPAVGGKAATDAADLPHLAPGADFPEPAGVDFPVTSHFPSGLKLTAGAPIDRQLGHLRAIA